MVMYNAKEVSVIQSKYVSTYYFPWIASNLNNVIIPVEPVKGFICQESFPVLVHFIAVKMF